jgi:tetratricopeptide (TPR) repeat protein
MIPDFPPEWRRMLEETAREQKRLMEAIPKDLFDKLKAASQLPNIADLAMPKALLDQFQSASGVLMDQKLNLGRQLAEAATRLQDVVGAAPKGVAWDLGRDLTSIMEQVVAVDSERMKRYSASVEVMRSQLGSLIDLDVAGLTGWTSDLREQLLSVGRELSAMDLGWSGKLGQLAEEAKNSLLPSLGVLNDYQTLLDRMGAQVDAFTSLARQQEFHAPDLSFDAAAVPKVPEPAHTLMRSPTVGLLAQVVEVQEQRDLVQGKICLQLQMWTDAESCFRRAANWSRESPEPYVGLGISLNAQGRHDEAVQAFEEVEERDPDLLTARPDIRRVYEASLQGHRVQETTDTESES